MNEISTFSALHENMKTVLEKPSLFAEKITRFSAGGLGACAYSDDITVGELARSWQHEEYHIKCPHCGTEAYITQWAGKVGSGGYWEIKAYCPHCGKEYRYDMYAAGNACRAHWTALRKTLQEEREVIKDMVEKSIWIFYIQLHRGNSLSVSSVDTFTNSILHDH